MWLTGGTAMGLYEIIMIWLDINAILAVFVLMKSEP
jgi:hypothetical protein